MVFKVFIRQEFLQKLWTKQNQDTPPPPLLQPWKWYQPLSEPNRNVLLIMRGIFIDDMHAIEWN